MKHSSMDSGCYMAEQLLFDILLWLPVTSLLRFKSVCKSWCALIDSPIFISQHFDYNSGNDNLLGICHDIGPANVESRKFCLLSGNKYEVYNNFDYGLPWHVVDRIWLSFSSNGIICLVLYSGIIYLWNPAMRQLRSLPKSPIPCQDYVSPLFGFGFSVRSNDHNIVKITLCNQNTSLVGIYSLRTDSWRTMHKKFSLPSTFCNSRSYHITKDGTCFWIAYSNDDDDTDGNVILSFDLNEETYETMPLPVGKVPISAAIDFLGDKLAYIQGVDSCLGYYEIWVLHEYGVKESWNKAWKIGPTDMLGADVRLYPSSFNSNGEFLLLTNEAIIKNFGLFHFYDLRTEENEYFELCQPNILFMWSIRYTDSLCQVQQVNDAH